MVPSALDSLVVAACAGEARAKEQLFTHGLADMRRTVSRVIGARKHKAVRVEELLEESSVHALRSLASLRVTTYAGFRAWFRAIARNRSRAVARAALVRALPVTRRADDELPAKEPRKEPVRRFVLVRLGVRRLAGSQRTAFVLREGLALSWITIGFVLARRPAEAARQVHVRARARLYRVSGHEYPAPRCAVAL